MKVYAVRACETYEYDDVESLWATEELALKEAARRRETDPAKEYVRYDVQEYEVYDE